MAEDAQRNMHALLTVVVSLLIFAWGQSGVAADSPASQRPPNIVLIFADDLGYGDVGCFNADCPFETPHLDQMADEGAKLTNFYVPTPYCAPSRGTILTGRYPFRHSVVSNPAPDAGINNFGLPPDEITIAELLKQEGYATAAFGKWHLGHQQPWLPKTQGFDEYFGILYSNDMFPVQLVEAERVVEYPVVQATLTQRYTDRAIDFIQRHREEPFFVYLPHAMPHKPLAVSEKFYTPQTRENLYADVIRELDAEIGRLLQVIQDLQLDEQTLVIFTSDNGPWYGGSTGGLRGMKSKSWEGGLRVPLIARMPGTIPAGLTNSAIAGTIDILPTIGDLVGFDSPADRVIDGVSLLDVLTNPAAEDPHEAIFSMKGERLSTIRSGAWKLHVLNPGRERAHDFTDEQAAAYVDPRGPDGVILLAPFEQATPAQYPGVSGGDKPQPMMLFNLEDDPGEQRNVAQDHSEIVERLHARFHEMEKQVPKFERPENDYLFETQPGQPRPLMRLLGGELEYDRLPPSQESMRK